jgi:hypothetical protein
MNVKISPDGRYLYATGNLSDALVVFERNLDSGQLNQVQTISALEIPALDGAREIGLSPDGTSLYVTGYLADAVTGFQLANPIPTLASLLPASAPAGSVDTMVMVQGENFIPGATVFVNGEARVTEFNHPGELEVELEAADLAGAGAITIEVVNPLPGGGPAVNSLFFIVAGSGENPVPSIDWLLPGGAAAGDPGISVAIHGANFANGASVLWNGQARPATLISSNELWVDVAAEELLIPGPVVVAVSNPAPGGGTSNSVTFEVAAPGQNPAPSITGILPQLTIARGAGSSPFQVRVLGESFIPESQGQWNGVNRPTQFVSESEVWLTLNSFDVAFSGSGAVSIANPAPGGGTSNPAAFTIYPYGIYLPLAIR